MKGLGSGNNGEFTFLDTISLISFIVGIQNLDMNISQEDMQKATERLDKSLRENVEEIHSHLESQDKKINEILRRLNYEEDRKDDEAH